MATTTAMSSYMALCGNEVVNGARLKAYVDNGIVPQGFEIKCSGCQGLEGILPCANSDPPANGYQLPELDTAPWYDARFPESANFAGLLVTEVTMTSPFSRTITQNVGVGQTLGRLGISGRTITVHGFLIGKTCCANAYGLNWLTTALTDPACGDGCTGCELDYLDCCPNICDEDECITTCDAAGKTQVFIRAAGQSEYQRGSDFFRRMNGVGLVSGPDIISCRGRGCGCGCSTLVEVEFVLAASSPYANSFGQDLLTDVNPPVCVPKVICDIVWTPATAEDASCLEDPACPGVTDCLDDPVCPDPALPPQGKPIVSDCGCEPFDSARICTGISPVRDWGSSTVNFEVSSGAKALRNLAIRIWQDPLALNCGDATRFPDCSACATLLVSYVPAGGVLKFSGEERKVTITCNGKTSNGFRNVTAIDGQPFAWPDLTCQGICACVTFDCDNISPDATVTITRIDRDL